MNTSALSVVAIVLSSVSIAALLWESPPMQDDEVAPVAPAPGADAAVLQRMEALSEENRKLRDRLAMLEVRPAPQRTPVLDGFVSKEEFDAFKDEVRAALSSPDALIGGSPRAATKFKEQVASTLSELRKAETVGKFRNKQESRVAGLDATMTKMDGWLGLTPQQSNSMRSALLAQYDREAELLRRWEAGEDSEVLGEVKASDRTAHRAALAEFLTPEQIQTFSSRGK
ncbi:MAG: hypothetical protein GY711_03300 [bacterium]|nr:hypothetical protein [bacterium]